MSTDVDVLSGAPTQRGRGPELLPFGWESDPTHPEQGESHGWFHFPAADDPHPGTARVLLMSGYAALLGLAGIGVGIRGIIAVLGGAPGWYVPVLTTVGLISVALAVGAFLSVHRRLLPWILLLAAAFPLLGDVLLATAY